MERAERVRGLAQRSRQGGKFLCSGLVGTDPCQKFCHLHPLLFALPRVIAREEGRNESITVQTRAFELRLHNAMSRLLDRASHFVWSGLNVAPSFCDLIHTIAEKATQERRAVL